MLRNLGKSGLRVSCLGLGTWVTFGSQISDETAENLMTIAYENGVNLFDTAEVYASGSYQPLPPVPRYKPLPPVPRYKPLPPVPSYQPPPLRTIRVGVRGFALYLAFLQRGPALYLAFLQRGPALYLAFLLRRPALYLAFLLRGPVLYLAFLLRGPALYLAFAGLLKGSAFAAAGL
ncbi:unnamed protein product [Gadus morhua 'NCC']